MSINRNASDLPNVITASGALILNLTSSDITYGGQSLARVGTANIFTVSQSVSAFSPSIRLLDTNSVDSDFRMEVGAGDLLIDQYTDAGAFSSRKLRLDSGAAELRATALDITYGGRSIISFGGRVNSTGVAVNLPNGWTSVRNSIGYYTITHSRNTLSYGATVSVEAVSGALVAATVSPASNWLDVRIVNSAGALIDSVFHFTMNMS